MDRLCGKPVYFIISAANTLSLTNTLAYYEICALMFLQYEPLCRVFNSGSGCLHSLRLYCYEVKRPNLNLKTHSKQFLEFLLLDIELPRSAYQSGNFAFFGSVLGELRTFKLKQSHSNFYTQTNWSTLFIDI